MRGNYNLKKWAVILLIIMVLTGNLPPAIVQAEQDEDGIELTMSSKSMPSGKYGSTISVKMDIKNTGSATAYDVKVSPNVDDAFASIFEVTTDTYKEISHDELQPDDNSNTGLYYFKIRSDAKSGYYPITFTAKYKEDEGRTTYRTTTGTIYVKVTGKTDPNDKAAKNVDFMMGEGQDTPFGTYPGVMDFTINVQNKGINTAYDVDVNMVLSGDVTEFPFEISMANYDRPLGTMNAGAISQVAYSMALREDIKTGYYPIKFNITYKDDKDGELLTSEQVFYVKTQGKDEEDEEESKGEIDVNAVAKPRLIISGFTTTPEVIMSGEEFTMNLKMQNSSKNITATNILFTLESEQVDGNDVFTPLSGSTSVVVDSLSPGQTTDIVMPMIAKAGLSPKSYTVKVKQKYDIEKLKSIEDTASVAIPVKQKAKLSVGNIEVMPESIEVGSESNIMFGINNTGKITLYNVNVAFSSDTISAAESFVGNIEPGQTGNVDVMLKGTSVTVENSKIKAVISYEDDAGVVSTTEKEFELQVLEGMLVDEGEFPADSGEMEFQPSPVAKYMVFILIGAIILGIVVIIVVVTIVKKKRMKKAEEGMADEIS